SPVVQGGADDDLLGAGGTRHPGDDAIEEEGRRCFPDAQRRGGVLTRGGQLRQPHCGEPLAASEWRQEVAAQCLPAAARQPPAGRFALAEDEASRETGAGQLLVAIE